MVDLYFNLIIAVHEGLMNKCAGIMLTSDFSE